MKTKGKFIFVSLLVISLMSSCATPIAVSTPTQIPTRTPTSTRTPTQTASSVPTLTPSPTLTPTPTSFGSTLTLINFHKPADSALTTTAYSFQTLADTLGWRLEMVHFAGDASYRYSAIMKYDESRDSYFNIYRTSIKFPPTTEGIVGTLTITFGSNEEDFPNLDILALGKNWENYIYCFGVMREVTPMEQWGDTFHFAPEKPFPSDFYEQRVWLRSLVTRPYPSGNPYTDREAPYRAQFSALGCGSTNIPIFVYPLSETELQNLQTLATRNN